METKNIIWLGVIAVVVILLSTILIYFLREDNSASISANVSNGSTLIKSNLTVTNSPPINNTTGKPLSPLAVNRTVSVSNNTSPFINKTKINSSTSNPIIAPVPIGTQKTWCNYGELWTNSKVTSSKTLIKTSFTKPQDELLCLVFSEDKTEEYAFTEGEVRVYKVLNPGAKALPILELLS